MQTKELWSKMWLGLFQFFFCGAVLIVHVLNRFTGWLLLKSKPQLNLLFESKD